MNFLRKYVGPLIPLKLRQWIWRSFRVYLNLFRHLAREFLRFRKYNLSVAMEADRALTRQLLMYSHILEKGLATKDSRPFFGRDVAMGLCRYLKDAKGRAGVPLEARSIAKAVVEAYLTRHEDVEGDEVESKFIQSVADHLAEAIGDDQSVCGGDGGVLYLDPNEIQQKAKGIGDAITSRHSIRMYEDTEIRQEVITECVRIASRSPSACNLQPTRVYVYQDKETIKKLLEVQGGARGFLTEVPLLFILTYELSLQIGPRSRMQGYTDTGLFAQSLMLTMLEKGLGSCPLNWAQEVHKDKKLRAIGKVRDSENIVMLLSAGKLPNNLKCAMSSRLPAKEKITFDSAS